MAMTSPVRSFRDTAGPAALTVAAAGIEKPRRTRAALPDKPAQASTADPQRRGRPHPRPGE